jgi:hypothetical protein
MCLRLRRSFRRLGRAARLELVERLLEPVKNGEDVAPCAVGRLLQVRLLLQDLNA